MGRMTHVMERLDLGGDNAYSANEAAIHLNRYLAARAYCSRRAVLDLACGQGYGAYLMAEQWGAAQVHAVDNSPEAIQAAREHFPSPRVSYHEHAAERIDDLFSPGQFDLIVSLETFEHLQDPGAVLAKLSRLLRPDGVLIVSCPNDHWYYRTPEESNPFHARKYTFEEFCSVCEGALGPAVAYQLGTPLAGYANVTSDAEPLIAPAHQMRAMLDARDSVGALLAPGEERIDWTNCNYYIGFWGPSSARPQATASLYASTMDANLPAHRQAQVDNLRQEVLALRDELFRVRNDEQWSRSQVEKREALAEELRRTVAQQQDRLVLAETRATESVAAREDIQRQFETQGAQMTELRKHADKLRAQHEHFLAERQRLAELEHELRTAGMRAAALQAEGQFLREQLRTKGAALESLQAVSTEQTRTIDEWRGYIQHIEHELQAAQTKLEHTLGARAKRLAPGPLKKLVKRLLGRTT